MNSLQLSQQAAASELLRRRRARNSLAEFAQAIDVPGKPISEDDDEWLFHPIETSIAAHHRILMDAAQRCIETHSGRLMIFMPPGSAKSTYASVVLPSWAMGKEPGFRVISTSYGSDLARKMGRRTRSIVRQPGYQPIFNATLSGESSAADEWALSNGSEYMSGGILSGITGNRAGLLTVDDPIKGREEANSDTIRNKIRDAFDDDLMSRLLPGGSAIIIQTRWHENDLSGGILPEDYNGESGMIDCRDGETWEVICLPAKAESDADLLGRKEGEYIWPEWFPESHWRRFERNPRTWASLYQQRPSPEDGDYFKREWLRAAPERDPLNMTVYGASDYAVTADGGDFTVHVVVGVDTDNRLHLLDLWRKQSDSAEWAEVFCDMVLKWRPVAWAEETGQIRASIGPFLEQRMRARNAWVGRETFPTRGDKAVRAQSVRGRMSLDGLYVDKAADWYASLEAELLSFPAGRNDDQVDALGLIGQLLDRMYAPQKQENEQKMVNDRHRRSFYRASSSETSWKTI